MKASTVLGKLYGYFKKHSAREMAAENLAETTAQKFTTIRGRIYDAERMVAVGTEVYLRASNGKAINLVPVDYSHGEIEYVDAGTGDVWVSSDYCYIVYRWPETSRRFSHHNDYLKIASGAL